MTQTKTEKSSLQIAEEAFAKERLFNMTTDNSYVYGCFEGDRDGFENIIEQFQLISSTSYVLAENHSKEKEHKRYSQSGNI